jgi:hypothetical protein
MATPHVSGAAALALATGYQSVATLRATILSTVDPIASQAGLTRTGGRLDVCKALPACSGVAPPSPLPSPPPPATGDFSIDASPRRDAVPPGGAISYNVTVTPNGGFTGLVALTVSGLPNDGSGSFGLTPLDVTPASSSTNLTVTTSPTTAPGNYTLTITAASGSLTHTATVILRVKRK